MDHSWVPLIIILSSLRNMSLSASIPWVPLSRTWVPHPLNASCPPSGQFSHVTAANGIMKNIIPGQSYKRFFNKYFRRIADGEMQFCVFLTDHFIPYMGLTLSVLWAWHGQYCAHRPKTTLKLLVYVQIITPNPYVKIVFSNLKGLDPPP